MKQHKETSNSTEYIELPRRKATTTVRIDKVLEKRMKEFLLSKRRRHWMLFGE